MTNFFKNNGKLIKAIFALAIFLASSGILIHGVYRIATQECSYTPEITVEDHRLCAPATYRSDCYRELGYKYECK